MKNRRILSVLLVFAMLITLILPMTVVTVSADVTLITNQAGLKAMSATGSYKLANDITISGTWEYSTVFTGALDGDGHTITYANGTTVIGGLFQQVSSKAVIQNLNLVQAGSTTYTPVAPSGSGAWCVGALVASIEYPADCNNTSITANADNTVKIRNVTVTANITSITTKDNNKGYAVGGLVGEIGMITRFDNCTFNGSISDGSRTNTDNNKYTSGYGGIVGVLIRNGGTLTVSQCINNGSITGYASMGGILGHAREWGGGATAPAAITIEKSINNGTINCLGTDTKSNVGGLAGYVYVKDAATATFKHCINTGTVTKASGSAHSGGILGDMRRNGTNMKFIGCVQESANVTGNQIATTSHGSGNPEYTKVYAYTTVSGQATGVYDAATYLTAYNNLNYNYPGVYALDAGGVIILRWTLSGVVDITNQGELAAMWDNGNFRLANDIIISGTWNYSTPFKGTLDGDGHTIIILNETVMTGGLFQQLSTKATVKNLNIVQLGPVTYTPVTPGGSGAYCVGVLAASIEYPEDCNNVAITSDAANAVNIQNVNVYADISSITTVDNNKGYAVGGLVGEIGMAANIENCTFTGSISDVSRTKVDSNKYESGYGGIVGVLIRNGGTLTVSQCINNASITAYGQEGGILGHAREWSGGGTAPAGLTIEQCINNGTINCLGTDTKSNVGGIAGYLYVKDAATATIRSCINAGIITKASGTAYAGGIVGGMRRNGTNMRFIGCLQESASVVGNQIASTQNGSGTPLYENNYARVATSGVCTAAYNASTFASAYTTLNAAYVGVYALYNDQVILAWADGEKILSVGGLTSGKIRNQADLTAMLATGSYTLENDITITGVIWDYISTFTGTLDGDGHTVTIADGTMIVGGLLRQLSSKATVKDINVVQEGSTVWLPIKPGGSGAYSVGGLVASIQYPADCNNTSITGAAANEVKIQNSNVTANITSIHSINNDQGYVVGGIVGEIGMIATIDTCTFSGSISDIERTQEDSGRLVAGYGGIVGEVIRNGGPLTIKKCFNSASISGYSQQGGILGYSRAWSGGGTGLSGLVIEECFNTGTISCQGTTAKSSAGGIAGYVFVKNGASAVFRYCINAGTVTRAATAARLGGILGDMRRGADNAVQFIGCLQESANVGGNQVATTSDGSGNPKYENVYAYTAVSGQATAANNASTYSTAYATLNAAYPGIYSYTASKVKLTWAIPYENAGGTNPTGSLERNEVSNQADLALMPSTGSYTLINDITIKGNWTYGDAFMGTLNGNGHTITFADGATVNGGLFVLLNQGATVKNLNIVAGTGVTWKPVAGVSGSASPCVGGLAANAAAGYVDGVSKWGDTDFVTNVSNIITVQNVTVSARIAISGGTGGEDKVAAGGIIGEVGIISLIQNCVFSGSVSDGTRSKIDMVAYESGYGGIVGVAIRNGGPVQIVECINNGSISGYGQQGGILGYSRAWGNGGTGLASLIIEKCINNGTITSSRTDSVNSTHYSTAGGIAGYIYVKNGGTATVLNNVNNGNVITQVADPEPDRADGLHPTYAGGIVGVLRRGTDDSFTISGNASRQGSVKAGGIDGGKYYGKDDGSGSLVRENNMSFGATPSGISTALAVLNATYSDTFAAGKNNSLTLTWANNKGSYLYEGNYLKMFSLGLDGIIQLRIGVAVPGAIPNSLHLVVSKGGEELQNVQMSNVYDAESGYYVVSVPILAKEMADANTYTLSVQNGGVTIWSTSQSISVKNYVAALKTHSEYSAWFDLVDAMLKYGAAAQNYFGYHTGALAANISGGISVDTSSLPSATVSGDRSFLQQIRGSLSLEAGTDLNFYFKPKTPGANLSVTVRKNGSVVNSGVLTEWVGEDGGADHVFLAARIQNLAADELDDWYDITVTDGSKSVTVHYSGLCWANVVLNDPAFSATSTRNLAKGIVLYANKANACAGNVEPIVIANANSASQYYISYPSGADTYLKSEILSYASKMSKNGIYIATAVGTKSLGKPITVTTNSSITGFQITFAANGNITVTGKDYLMAQNGFHYLVDTMITRTSDGSYIITNPTNVSNTATAYTRSGWLLAAPAYEGGTLASALYDEGTGLATDDGTTVNAERSYAMYIRSTNATQFNTYTNKLVSNGYTLDASNSFAAKSNGSSLFRTYRRGTQVLFLYFDAANGVARVIDDLVSTPESEFEYTFSYTSSTATDLVLYGLKYNTQGYSPTESNGDSTIANSGALIIIKQADNSVMLIDGGLYLQGTDTAVAGLWNYLHTITGKSANADITVSCWYVTHPHNDHYYLVSALLEKYHDKIDLQRVMFNFPKYVNDKGYQEDIRTMARAYYPEVKFMKCHTGQSIQLGSLKLDVMATHEDLVNTTSGTVTFEEGNDMTTMLRITFPDGSRFMSMGDATEDVVVAGAISRLAASELSCKYFEVPHHGYNELYASQCNVFKPKYIFFPNASYGSFPSSGTYKWRRSHCKNNYSCLLNSGGGATDSTVYFAGSNTYKLTITNGSVSVTTTSVVP